MFGHSPFYFSTIRKMVIYFGNCFNDLHITREDSSGNTVQIIRVPLTYAPKDKILARFPADPTIDRPSAITLPRMSFEMSSFTYDPDRKLITVGKTVRKDETNAGKLRRQYNPVPYNIGFRLYIYVKNAEDGTKIVEQILPHFTPEWTATINLIPEMEVDKDIPIILNNVSMEDTYAGAYTERRHIIWTLDFTVKTFFYGPIVSKPIIKIANTNFYVHSGNTSAPETTEYLGRMTVTPGLTANGTPTSNGQLSVNTSLIEVDDDFGFVVDVTDNVYLLGEE